MPYAAMTAQPPSADSLSGPTSEGSRSKALRRPSRNAPSGPNARSDDRKRLVGDAAFERSIIRESYPGGETHGGTRRRDVVICLDLIKFLTAVCR